MGEGTLLMLWPGAADAERIIALGGRPSGSGLWIVPSCPLILARLEEEADASSGRPVFLGSIAVSPLTAPWTR